MRSHPPPRKENFPDTTETPYERPIARNGYGTRLLQTLKPAPLWWRPTPTKVANWYWKYPGESNIDFAWEQLECLFTKDYTFAPLLAFKPPDHRKGRRIWPTGVGAGLAFKEVQAPKEYVAGHDEANEALLREELGYYGDRANTWLDEPTRKALRRRGQMPVWDGHKSTLEKWVEDFLRWKEKQKGQFSKKLQMELVVIAIENNEKREQHEKQLEQLSLEEDFQRVWEIITGRALPDDVKENNDFEKYTFGMRELTAEPWVYDVE